jgi:hypothetical protein
MEERPPGTDDARVRVLITLNRDGALIDLLVGVTCPCGTYRHIEPEALARIAGRSVALARLATRMRCLQCRKQFSVAGRAVG